ncbi:MAG TPA: hypothetical protein VH189_01840 [Rhizomicrobium sp.]|nr:hypothetical protein [Rhizomicrobium sp.]
MLEHILFEKVPVVLDEIYGVLKPSGTFRLSVPDYRSPVQKRRSDGAPTSIIADFIK